MEHEAILPHLVRHCCPFHAIEFAPCQGTLGVSDGASINAFNQRSAPLAFRPRAKALITAP